VARKENCGCGCVPPGKTGKSSSRQEIRRHRRNGRSEALVLPTAARGELRVRLRDPAAVRVSYG
jgi:hypothetical protein